LLKQIMPHLMGLIYVLQQMVITSTLLQWTHELTRWISETNFPSNS
jgi:hypothetical protein